MRHLQKIKRFVSQNPSIPIYAISILVLASFMQKFAASLDPLTVPDLKIFYIGQQYIPFFLEAIGTVGRASYEKLAVIDLIYMLCYTLLFLKLNKTFLQIGLFSRSISRYLLWLPLLILGFDLYETLGMIYFSKSFPLTLPLLAASISVTSFLKWLGVCLQIFLLVFVLLRAWLKPAQSQKA